jgi:subtilisin-like proprotein convertase family protein
MQFLLGSRFKRPTAALLPIFLLALLAPSLGLAQVVYTYDAVPSPGAITDNACTAVTINVPDSFNVGNAQVGVGVDVTHTWRGDLSIQVDPPEAGEGNRTVLGASGGDRDNLRIMLSTNSDTTATDDGDNDAAGQTVRYRRLMQYTTNPFDDNNTNHPVNGDWVIRVCDGANGDTGTFNSVRLVLRHDAGTAPNQCGTKTSFAWGGFANNAVFTSTSTRGITLSQGGTSGEAPNDSNTGAAELSFRIHTSTTLGGVAPHYFFSMNTTGDTEASIEYTDLVFNVPVYGLTLTGLDIDRGNNAYEDYFRVDGFGVDDATTVPKQVSIVNTGNLAFAGDWVEADNSAVDTGTDGNVAYTFAGPVRRVRVAYAQGDQPATNSDNQWVGISGLSYCGFDFGDAPNVYDTNYASGGARHALSSRAVYMGTVPDGETDGVAGSAANTDGADEAGSLTFPTVVSTPTPHFECAWAGGTYSTAPGELCFTVNVTNTSGSGAQLVGWVDLNNDGDFLDANERSLPRLGGFVGGAEGDNTFTTPNIPDGVINTTRVLVWSGLPGPVLLSQSYLRLRITTDSSFMSDASPQPVGEVSDGEVEDHLLPASTLPVTLASVRSTVVAGQVEVNFTTASETDHVGFTIEERDGSGWKILHDLVASDSSTSTEVRSYAVRLPSVPASGSFYIADHDIRGRRTVHGPFAVGASIGQDLSADRFDWTATAAEVAQARGHAGRVAAGKLWVTTPGFHRVTAAQLVGAGVDLLGVPVDRIAITFRGRGVPRRVVPADGEFGADSYIDFLASEDSSLYTREFPYLIKADGVGVIAIDRNERLADEEQSVWYWAESTYAPDRIYNASSPTSDPWFAVSLLGRPGSAATLQRTLSVSALAADVDFAELSAELTGITNWDGPQADHHVQLQSNGQLLQDERFDGVVATTLRARLPLFGDGNLDVRVVVPGDTGYSYDMNYVEALHLRYPRLPRAESGRLWIGALQSPTRFFDEGGGDNFADSHLVSGFEGPDSVPGFRVDGLASGEVVAYVGRGDDWDWLVHSSATHDGTVLVPSDSGSSYWVSNTSGLLDARIEPMAAIEDIVDGEADYLIVSPGVFLGELQPLIDLQQARGLRTRVVDLQQIYDQFNHSVPEAVAIQRFLDRAAPATGAKYVLLVGGDTYDYKNFLGTGSISMVPTQYAKVGESVTFAPVDALYADPDRDGAPEFALGRLPVRSIAELRAMLAKLVAVESRSGERKLMLVAQAADEDGAYAEISDAFASTLPDEWNTTRGYVDSLGTAGTRALLLAALNADYDLLSYVGHSAPSQWSFDPILTSADILNATGAPVDLVVQWGCWNSYFVSPSANTLAHRFLNTAGHGAAGVVGVTSLTELESHEALGQRLYPELAAGTRVGDALRFAKMHLAIEGERYRDILMTATLLGDPAMPIR